MRIVGRWQRWFVAGGKSLAEKIKRVVQTTQSRRGLRKLIQQLRQELMTRLALINGQGAREVDNCSLVPPIVELDLSKGVHKNAQLRVGRA